MREVKKVLIVVITSNKGLCGAFNANVIRMATQMATEKYSELNETGSLEFYAIGKKGGEMLKSKEFNVVESDYKLLDHLSFQNVEPLVENIMESFVKKEYDIKNRNTAYQ